MMQNVHRFYDATPVWQRANPITDLTATQIKALPSFPNVMQVTVPPEKPFRKIWGYLYYDTSNRALIEFAIVCYLQKREVYRQRILRMDSAGWPTSTTQFLSTIVNTTASWPGAVAETLRVVFANGASYEIVPIALNLTCDLICLEVKDIQDITGGPMKWRGNLFVRSEAGI